MLGIISYTYRELSTDESVPNELNTEREVTNKVLPCKLQYFGHVANGSAG